MFAHEHEKDSEFEIEADAERHDDSDAPDLETAEATVQDSLKALRQKLRNCEEEKRTHLEELQRTKADFLNARRRLEEERARDATRIETRFIEELLPMCDSFHMAMQNEEVWQSVDAQWRRGVESIKDQLTNVLATHDVSMIDAAGASFDPELHEAVTNEPVADASLHHSVVRVLQPGYQMTRDGETIVLRPARVTVGELAANE